jgi:hypothetical protein
MTCDVNSEYRRFETERVLFRLVKPCTTSSFSFEQFSIKGLVLIDGLIH